MGIEAITSGLTRWYSEAGICLDIQVVNVDEEFEAWTDDGVTTFYAAVEGTWPLAVFDIINKRAGITNAVGLTLFPMKDVFLKADYYSLRQVAMHEMGHVLGIMEHNPDRLSTMYHIALSGGLQDVSRKDARMAAELNPTHRCR
jgi:predicted Zn-dependent protease